MLTELLSTANKAMSDPMTAVVLMNGATLIGVIKISMEMGALKKMFRLVWADFAKRKGLQVD